MINGSTTLLAWSWTSIKLIYWIKSRLYHRYWDDFWGRNPALKARKDIARDSCEQYEGNQCEWIGCFGPWRFYLDRWEHVSKSARFHGKEETSIEQYGTSQAEAGVKAEASFEGPGIPFIRQRNGMGLAIEACAWSILIHGKDFAFKEASERRSSTQSGSFGGSHCYMGALAILHIAETLSYAVCKELKENYTLVAMPKILPQD